MIAAGCLVLLLAAGPAAPNIASLAGAWSGTASHDGDTVALGLELLPQEDATVRVRATIPSLHLSGVDIARSPASASGREISIPPFTFHYDAEAGTLSGILPRGLVPVYEIPFTLRRGALVAAPARGTSNVPTAAPDWTFDAGAAVWAGPAFSDGTVYAGDANGVLHAIDARSGTERWSFHAGGEIRTRPAVAEGRVYFQADDGVLYALAAEDGAEAFRVRLMEKPVTRLPFDDPKSRYDRFGSDVTIDGDRLYLGTDDGRLVALEASTGRMLWEFAAEDSILAAPTVAGGRAFFGSFDGHVYALDLSGRLVWKRDTQGAIVSTPAVAGDRLVVGNRCYDLLALDTGNGSVVWKRYLWFSWVESSPTIREGVAYVGSSDAASVFAFDVRSGERAWATYVSGWSWGQPAVTAERVYAGVSSQVGYMVEHRGGVLALDRSSGRILWQHPAAAPAAGPFGFAGSPAVGGGRVFVADLSGRVWAFPE